MPRPFLFPLTEDVAIAMLLQRLILGHVHAFLECGPMFRLSPLNFFCPRVPLVDELDFVLELVPGVLICLLKSVLHLFI